MSFGVITFNMPGRIPDWKVRRWLSEEAKTRASILLLQEAREHDAEIRRSLKGWALLDDNGPNAQPFVVNTDHWNVIEHDSFVSTPSKYVGKAGAGPSRLKAKHVHWITVERRFPNRSRQPKNPPKVTIFNNHAVPSIYLDVRDEMHEEHMRELAQKVERVRRPVIVGGDFNAEWGHPNMRPLRRIAGMRLDNPPRPTHGRRRIDLLMHRDGSGRGLRMVKRRVLPKLLRDDHSPVYIEYEFHG